MSEWPAPVCEGDVLAGKYRVERVIGQGGMGVVVAVQHLQLGKRLAAKFLLPQACKDAEVVGRFLREARAAVRIESEHVARVIDVGTLENGAPYMVMEYLVGSDLSQVVRTRGPLPVEEAVDYVLQACEAIAEAHALGIVHRDLKPANLFLTQRKDGSPLVKVLDFGISKASTLGTEGEPQSMTASWAVMGSPQYMSPEQMRSSKNVDGRTDIWALGVILYELIAGRPVYEADTLPGLCAMIATDAPLPLRSWRSDVPQELEAVVLQCLAKDPAQRVHDVGALATALFPFGPKGCRLSVERVVRVIEGAGLANKSLTIPPLQDTAVQPHTSNTAGAWGTTRPPQSRSGVLIAFGAIGGAALLAGALLLWWRTKGVSPSPGLLADNAVATATAPTQPPTASQTVDAAIAAPPIASASAPAAALSSSPVQNDHPPPTKVPGTGSAKAAPTASIPQKTPRTNPVYNPLDHL